MMNNIKAVTVLHRLAKMRQESIHSNVSRRWCARVRANAKRDELHVMERRWIPHNWPTIGTNQQDTNTKSTNANHQHNEIQSSVDDDDDDDERINTIDAKLGNN
jgi:hypothetical protein